MGLAIGVVCGAGAATAIGASAVFFPSIVKLASRKTLAASLGLSAGVMVYVSFVEIFAKAVDAFGPDQAGFTEDKAFNYATLTFFCGVVLMKVSPPSPISIRSRHRFLFKFSIIPHPFLCYFTVSPIISVG